MNRDEQNKILRANGYKWVKYDQDELDDNDDFDRNPGWYLFAANGREVSVQRAMREIEIGVETVAKGLAYARPGLLRLRTADVTAPGLARDPLAL